jgi:LmbE family N-acetylglucosaminyl deacetylase
MNPYEPFVKQTVEALRQARNVPLGTASITELTPPKPGTSKALIFSPHPDDEAIVGGYALRLLRQSGWQVHNVAVTQGSNKARQLERWKELTACCQYLGFGLIQTRENGLEGISAKTRQNAPADWARSVDCIARILQQEQPRAIFLPHAEDWNSTHIGTHYLVLDALSKLGRDFACWTIETEFWGAMDHPNLMVELNETDVMELIAGLSFHVGEVQRNPYHLRLPAWMIDNVRRGGELVGGQGGAAPDFTFATLYRLRRWSGGQWTDAVDRGRFISRSEDPAAVLTA